MDRTARGSRRRDAVTPVTSRVSSEVALGSAAAMNTRRVKLAGTAHAADQTMPPRPVTEATRASAVDLADQVTFARVHRAHATSVHRTALRILHDHGRAEDVTQDVFLRVWSNPRCFDHHRGDLGAYLRLMARSRAIDLWRQISAPSWPVAAVADFNEPPEHAVEHHPAAMLERQEECSALRQAVRDLPTHQREALVLFYWGDMTGEEIARHVGAPLGTAKSRIRLALARLRHHAVKPAADDREREARASRA
jgi:RNA polymerase sigma-70 factor, ECF subfamily